MLPPRGPSYPSHNGVSLRFVTTVLSERQSTGTGFRTFKLVPFLGMKSCIVQGGRRLLAAARLRFLARLPRAPVAVFALLQVASGEWRDLLIADLAWLRTALGSAVASLPAPAVSLQPWLDVAGASPVQWKQLVKRFGTRVVEEHQAQHQLDIRSDFEDLVPFAGGTYVGGLWRCIADGPMVAVVRPGFWVGLNMPGVPC